MSEIIHKGIVKEIKGEQIEVDLIDVADCESCSHKGGCQAGSVRDNKVFAAVSDTEYTPGEQISVHMTSSLAFSALFWAYVFPFIVVMVAIIALSGILGELVAALSALAFLVAYYFMVYLNRKYFDKKFSLTINKLKHD